MIIVDTNVVSELMKPSPSPTVSKWVRAREHELFTTAITLAEIRYGIARLPDGQRKVLMRATAQEVFAAFGEQVLSFDPAATPAYAEVVCERGNLGLPIDGFDAQIAAICRTYDAGVATRNVKDFQATGLEVIDPWQ